jgi:hypothetical protein
MMIQTQEYPGVGHYNPEDVRQIIQISVGNTVYEMNEFIETADLMVEIDGPNEKKTIIFRTPGLSLRQVLVHLGLNVDQFELDASDENLTREQILRMPVLDIGLAQATIN